MQHTVIHLWSAGDHQDLTRGVECVQYQEKKLCDANVVKVV
jgi:hypothetical protein